jgi:hypothetical protein
VFTSVSAVSKASFNCVIYIINWGTYIFDLGNMLNWGTHIFSWVTYMLNFLIYVQLEYIHV